MYRCTALLLVEKTQKKVFYVYYTMCVCVCACVCVYVCLCVGVVGWDVGVGAVCLNVRESARESAHESARDFERECMYVYERVCVHTV